MRNKKHRHKPETLKDLQKQKKKVRTLGYKDTEEYEKGLSTVKRLLARKKRNENR